MALVTGPLEDNTDNPEAKSTGNEKFHSRRLMLSSLRYGQYYSILHIKISRYFYLYYAQIYVHIYDM